MALPPEDKRRYQLNENIIRQLYYVAYLKGCKLPQTWTSTTSLNKAGISVNGQTVAADREATQEVTAPSALRADNSIPLQCSVYYFEVTINMKSRSGSLAVGFCTANSSLSEWPGMESSSFGYHSNNGTVFHSAKEYASSGPTFGETDVIGCGVNFVTNSVFFVKNGVFMGPIGVRRKMIQPIYPCLALTSTKCHLSANFGQHKFTFDIEQYIARERATVIGSAVDHQLNDQLAHVTMRNLVASYLLHNGYLDTAVALGGWTSGNSSETTGSTTPTPTTEHNGLDPIKFGKAQRLRPTTHTADPTTPITPDPFTPTPVDCPTSLLQSPNGVPPLDPDSSSSVYPLDVSSKCLCWPEPTELLLRRRELRNTICQGDYLSALDQLEAHFTRLSQQDPSISFVLRCHHFIHLMCTRPETDTPHSEPTMCSSDSDLQASMKNGSHSTTPEVHFGCSQKRSNPECSPELTTNGHSNGNHFAAAEHPSHPPQPLDSQESSNNNSNNGHSASASPTPSYQHRHEHSPSSCQAPVRLRLDPLSSRPTSLIGAAPSTGQETSTPMPVYPTHHQCYKSQSSCPPDPVGCVTASRTHTNDNGVSSRSLPADPHRRERRIISGIRSLSACSQSHGGIERGLASLGAAVGLVDVTDAATYGNGIDGTKCLPSIPRSPLKSLLNPLSSPTGCSIGLSANSPFQSDGCLNPTNQQPLVSDPPPPYLSHPAPISQPVGNGLQPLPEHQLNGDSTLENETQSAVPQSAKTTTKNGLADTRPVTGERCHSVEDMSPTCWSSSDVLHLIEYGRQLRATALELHQRQAITHSQIQLLNGAFGLIAYQDPFSSPFRKFLDPIHRERLADAVNSAIMVHLNKPANPILDSALAFLENALMMDEPVRTIPASSIPQQTLNTAPNYPRPIDRLSAPNYHVGTEMIANQIISAISTTPTLTRRGSDPSNQLHRSINASVTNAPMNSNNSNSGNSYSRLSPYRSSTVSRVTRTGSNLTNVQSQGISGIFTTDDSTTPRATILTSSVYISPSVLVSVAARNNPPVVEDATVGLAHPSSTTPTVPITSPSLRPSSLTTDLSRNTPTHPSSATVTPSRTQVTSSASRWSGIPSNTEPDAPRIVTRAGGALSTLTRRAFTTTGSPTTATAPPSLSRASNAPRLSVIGPELAGFLHPLLFVD